MNKGFIYSLTAQTKINSISELHFICPHPSPTIRLERYLSSLPRTSGDRTCGSRDNPRASFKRRPTWICKDNVSNFETCHGIKVNDVSVAFTNDTGASITFMSNKVHKQNKNRPKVGDTIGVLNACGMNLKQNLLSIIIILLLK